MLCRDVTPSSGPAWWWPLSRAAVAANPLRARRRRPRRGPRRSSRPSCSLKCLTTRRRGSRAWEFDGPTLYEGTGVAGQSQLRRTRSGDGRCSPRLRRCRTTITAEGITVVGDRIWELTWQNGVAVEWDKNTLTPHTGGAGGAVRAGDSATQGTCSSAVMAATGCDYPRPDNFGRDRVDRCHARR